MPKNKKALLYGDLEAELGVEEIETVEEIVEPVEKKKKEKYTVRLITAKRLVLVDSSGNGTSITFEKQYENLKEGDTLLLSPE